MKIIKKDKEKSNQFKNYKPKKITKRRNAIDENCFLEKWESKILDDIIEFEQELKNKTKNIIEEHNYSLKIS